MNMPGEAADLVTLWRPVGPRELELIRDSAQASASRGAFAAMIDGDYPVFGIAYARTTEPQRHRLFSIVYERFKTLSWMCGEPQDW